MAIPRRHSRGPSVPGGVRRRQGPDGERAPHQFLALGRRRIPGARGSQRHAGHAVFAAVSDADPQRLLRRHVRHGGRRRRRLDLPDIHSDRQLAGDDVDMSHVRRSLGLDHRPPGSRIRHSAARLQHHLRQRQHLVQQHLAGRAGSQHAVAPVVDPDHVGPLPQFHGHRRRRALRQRPRVPHADRRPRIRQLRHSGHRQRDHPHDRQLVVRRQQRRRLPAHPVARQHHLHVPVRQRARGRRHHRRLQHSPGRRLGRQPAVLPGSRRRERRVRRRLRFADGLHQRLSSGRRDRRPGDQLGPQQQPGSHPRNEHPVVDAGNQCERLCSHSVHGLESGQLHAASTQHDLRRRIRRVPERRSDRQPKRSRHAGLQLDRNGQAARSATSRRRSRSTSLRT